MGIALLLAVIQAVCTIQDLAQRCRNSNALAMELLQSCAEPSEWSRRNPHPHTQNGFINVFIDVLGRYTLKYNTAQCIICVKD